MVQRRRTQNPDIVLSYSLGGGRWAVGRGPWVGGLVGCTPSERISEMRISESKNNIGCAYPSAPTPPAEGGGRSTSRSSARPPPMRDRRVAVGVCSGTGLRPHAPLHKPEAITSRQCHGNRWLIWER